MNKKNLSLFFAENVSKIPVWAGCGNKAKRVLQSNDGKGILSKERLPGNIHVAAPDTSKSSSGTFVYAVWERLIQTRTGAEEGYKTGGMKMYIDQGDKWSISIFSLAK